MIAAAERHLIHPPDLYQWAFPGSPLRVHLDLSVVRRIRQALTARAGVAGILLGGSSGAVTTVKDVEFLSAGLESGLGPVRVGRSDCTPVGFFRTHAGEPLQLNDTDRTLARRFFPDPHCVFLLVQDLEDKPGTPNATFYFWEEGVLNGDFPFLEFPFDSEVLETEEQIRDESRQRRAELAAAQQQEEKPAPPAHVPISFAAEHPPAGSSRRLGLFTAVTILLALAVLAGLGVIPIPDVGGWIATFRTPAVNSFGLHAKQQQNEVRLTWNHQSDVIKTAESAVLSVRDGSSDRKIDLSLLQLRTGTVLYIPLSDHVQVELAVTGAGQTTRESVVVLLPPMPVPVQSLRVKTAQ